MLDTGQRSPSYATDVIPVAIVTLAHADTDGGCSSSSRPRPQWWFEQGADGYQLVHGLIIQDKVHVIT